MERLPLSPPPVPPPPPPVVIPDELIREILLLLPVKSLVRFTSVCKSWKLIISDHQFVNLHHRRTSSNTANLACTRMLFDLFNSHVEDPPDVRPHSVPPLLFSSQNQTGHDLYPIENKDGFMFRVSLICNGLVCLMKFEYYVTQTSSTVQVQFWNPATRLRSQVSPPLYMFHCRTFGFGYDCLNDTYKVVAVDNGEEHKELVVKVYDMGGSCWRTIQPFPTPSMISHRRNDGVYVSSTLNWVVAGMTSFYIVSLDLGTEEYSQLLLPDSCQSGEPFLGVLKDCLCILGSNEDDNTKFVFWQMKEFGVHQSWTQLYNFVIEDLYYEIGDAQATGFVWSENDEVLLILDYIIVLYNPRDNTFEISYEFHSTSSIRSWNAENYVESLVSPC